MLHFTLFCFIGTFISPFDILHWQEKLKSLEIQNVEKRM